MIAGALVVSGESVTVFCSIPGKQLKLVCFRHHISVIAKKKTGVNAQRTGRELLFPSLSKHLVTQSMFYLVSTESPRRKKAKITGLVGSRCESYIKFNRTM